MAHKYKIIQTLSFSNFIYKVRYIIVFYTKLTHLIQKLKNVDQIRYVMQN